MRVTADDAHDRAASAGAGGRRSRPRRRTRQPCADGHTHLARGRRAAASVEGVDVSGRPGSGPAGRIIKADVLAAAGDGAAAPAAPAGAQLMKGSAAALARYMEESRSIPTATSFRTLTVTVLDARRKELKAAGRKVSFTHLIAYAIARAAARACRSWPTTSPRSTASPTGSTTARSTSASPSTWRRRTAPAR